MLIYTDNSSIPFGSVGYKSASNRGRSSIQSKTLKRSTHPQYRSNSVRKVRKSKKKLLPKNISFLKKLGLQVKKH